MNFLNKIRFGKKGTDKMLSIYWFAILFLVAGGIFAMVYVFYSHPYDVRNIEADILNNKVADCISREGKINLDLESIEETDFLKLCNLNFNVEDEFEWKKQGQYYLEVNFYTLEDTSNSLFNIEEGNKNLFSSCELQKENNKEYNKLAKCVEKRFYSVDSKNKDKQYLIKILSVVRKAEKNVK